jgi:hypothetical protein
MACFGFSNQKCIEILSCAIEHHEKELQNAIDRNIPFLINLNTRLIADMKSRLKILIEELWVDSFALESNNSNNAKNNEKSG